MVAILVALLTFALLTGAAFASLILHRRVRAELLQDETDKTIRLVANIFVVMTSLMLGLMVNSARGTYEAIDRNIHAFATDLILLDRTIRALGPAGEEAHRTLAAYTRQAAADMPVMAANRDAERMLDAVGMQLRAIRVTGDQDTAVWNDARALYRQVVQQRWVLVEESEGTIPPALVVLLIAWLVLIFASFGWRAPRNAAIATIFIPAAALLSAPIYLILDMDSPGTGAIRASNAPVVRALAEIER